MKNSYKLLYVELLEKKYTDSETLIFEALKNEEHALWGACRDVAREQLGYTRWRWLSERIDDFALEATRHMIKHLPKWQWKARFGIGALSKHINEVEKCITWIINRWISILKNLFDKRYKFSIQPSYIQPFHDSTMHYM